MAAAGGLARTESTVDDTIFCASLTCAELERDDDRRGLTVDGDRTSVSLCDIWADFCDRTGWPLGDPTWTVEGAADGSAAGLEGGSTCSDEKTEGGTEKETEDLGGAEEETIAEPDEEPELGMDEGTSGTS